MATRIEGGCSGLELQRVFWSCGDVIPQHSNRKQPEDALLTAWEKTSLPEKEWGVGVHGRTKNKGRSHEGAKKLLPEESQSAREPEILSRLQEDAVHLCFTVALLSCPYGFSFIHLSQSWGRDALGKKKGGKERERKDEALPFIRRSIWSPQGIGLR